MEKITIPDNIKSVLQQIENVPDWWAEIPLPDHSILANFNRKLVVSGFNFPDLSEENDNRAEIFIRQIFTHKESGDIFTDRRVKSQVFISSSETYLRKDNSPDIIKVDRLIESEDSDPIRDKVNISVNRLNYIKRNLISNVESLKFILEDILTSYFNENANDLDRL